MQQIPILLRGGTNGKKPHVKQYSKKVNNNNKGSMNVEQKNDVQTTAALLRVCKQRTNQTRTD
jgi:hypothetical protein